MNSGIAQCPSRLHCQQCSYQCVVQCVVPEATVSGLSGNYKVMAKGTTAMGFLRGTAVCVLAVLAFLLGTTKVSSRGAAAAHELWLRAFESNFAPACNVVLGDWGLRYKISHTTLRLAVGWLEISCGLLLVLGSRIAAALMTLLLLGLTVAVYHYDPERIAFPTALLALAAFVTTGKNKK